MTIDCYVSVNKNDVCIVAVDEKRKEIGSLLFDLHKEGGNIYAENSYLISKVSNQGVHRALIRQAAKTLQEIATKKDVSVIDDIYFADKDERRELSPILKKYGYKEYSGGYQRIYEPKY